MLGMCLDPIFGFLKRVNAIFGKREEKKRCAKTLIELFEPCKFFSMDRNFSDCFSDSVSPPGGNGAYQIK
jgi:hypothetical protein